MNNEPNVFAEGISKAAIFLVGIGVIVYALSDHNCTPKSGNATIEKCCQYFIYYDRQFMLKHMSDGCVARSGSLLGFTASVTNQEQ
jgi:hypothetical protein